MAWLANDIPPLRGKKVLITGANSGLGFASALAMARKGAHVIMACRNPDKASAAEAKIRASMPDATLEPLAIDLMSLQSVQRAAEQVLATHDRLDVLLNNAGVMAMPLQRTAEGFESQFGTNHLAHFALSARLFPLLARTPGARVVSVSSVMHWMGPIRFDDLAWQRGYNKWFAYGMSKIANLLFTYELARRCAEHGVPVTAAAAHPGYSSTNLELRPSETVGNKLKRAVVGIYNPLVAQPAAIGALPQLYAATAPDVRPGSYYGPRFLQLWGAPKQVGSSRRSRDPETMKRLWQVSAELTGVDFQELAPRAAGVRVPASAGAPA